MKAPSPSILLVVLPVGFALGVAFSQVIHRSPQAPDGASSEWLSEVSEFANATGINHSNCAISNADGSVLCWMPPYLCRIPQIIFEGQGSSVEAHCRRQP